MANDTDVDTIEGLNKYPEGEALSVSISGEELAAPGHGAIRLNGDNTITYTPEPNYSGSDSFDYYVVDGSDVKSKGTVSVIVTPVNDTPQFDSVPAAMPLEEDHSGTETLVVSDIETTEALLEITAITSSNPSLIKTSGRDVWAGRAATTGQ